MEPKIKENENVFKRTSIEVRTNIETGKVEKFEVHTPDVNNGGGFIEVSGIMIVEDGKVVKLKLMEVILVNTETKKVISEYRRVYVKEQKS